MTRHSAASAARTRAPKECASCGAEFTAIKTAKFCSNRCRQAAKYARSKA